MKKIKYLTLALLLGALLVPAGVNAAETKSVPITQNVSSSYNVALPKSIDMGTAKTVNYTYTVTGNIDPTEAVSVTADSKSTMTRTNDSTTTVQASVVVNKTSFSETDINGGGAGTGTVTSNPIKAGSYTGTAVFHLDLTTK